MDRRLAATTTTQQAERGLAVTDADAERCRRACVGTGMYKVPFYFQLFVAPDGEPQCACCQNCTPFYVKNAVIFQANVGCNLTGGSCESTADCCTDGDFCIDGTCGVRRRDEYRKSDGRWCAYENPRSQITLTYKT